MNQRQTGIPAELVRCEGISQARPAAHVPQRQGLLNTAAARLTRRGMMAAKAEIANAALLELVTLLYEADTDGGVTNIDDTCRVLIPLPWGRMGAKVWGLRAGEANALRWIMFQRAALSHPAPLLDYERGGRFWFVSWTDYPTLQRALGYLQTHPVTVNEWRRAWRATRSTWAVKTLGME